MRFWCAGLLTACLIGHVYGQEPRSGSESQPQANGSERGGQPEKNKIATLVGCIERGSTPNSFTLADEQNGKYLLNGSKLSKYVGQRVQLFGSPDSSKLRIAGGLWPSPNVAAQGGAIDPAQAAIAAQPGGPSSGTGDTQLPRFKVKSVQTVGGCR